MAINWWLAAVWAAADDPRLLVYITFGSIIGGLAHLRSIYRTSLDAVAELPVRALLTTGHGVEAGALGAIPANVHVEAWSRNARCYPARRCSSVTAAPEPCSAVSPRACRW